MLETSIPHVKKNQNQNLVINPVSFEALHEKKEKKFAFSHTIIINYVYNSVQSSVFLFLFLKSVLWISTCSVLIFLTIYYLQRQNGVLMLYRFDS